nr:MAG TPA: hypothetical protein [Caudoviricetes sp.]
MHEKEQIIKPLVKPGKPCKGLPLCPYIVRLLYGLVWPL